MRQKSQIQIDGFAHPVSVHRNPRARHISLRVSSTQQEAILTLPPRAKLHEAESFITQHIKWLEKQFNKLPTAIPLAHGNIIPLRGEDHRLNFEPQKGKRGVVNTGTIEDEQTLFVSGTPEHAPRRLLDWLKKQARHDLDARVTWHAANLDLKPKRISIRDQSSRWGSCSTTGVLSFSWRLILAPPSILDYLAAHEVAHLAEMNHGPRFWRLVEKTMPDLEQAKYWLKQQGNNLHRYDLP